MLGMAVNRSVSELGSNRLAKLSPGERPASPVSAPTRMSGAASPMARAIDSSAPVRMPGMA